MEKEKKKADEANADMSAAAFAHVLKLKDVKAKLAWIIRSMKEMEKAAPVSK